MEEREEREELFRGTRPNVVSTNLDHPEDGRTFVWAWTEWFERLEGADGAVVFMPVAASEPELRKWLSQEDPDIDIYEVSGRYARDVRDEFTEQVPLFPEAREVSSQPPFGEQNPEADEEHF